MPFPMNPPEGYVSVATLEVDSVRPRQNGFVLTARGEDTADYLLQLHLDMPVDNKTQAVLGEILSQSEWRVWRRTTQPLRPRSRGGVPSS